ncbi:MULTISPECIES: response regulator transcription factor [unclassified Lysinibacillus]|uniref:response regulator transcription factor n=1 Tax=unclassified Lysinibacillus TaxID=2636778 RepID=UPI00116FE545|nr:response regulator transcription factor [Lysinibacillus sp. CD3-6]QPQ36177.1 response regulator transcription factor [Lysinibacillus sp. JNUCC-52]UED82164.1 response regulator transcription factor [Lysinibacillus sp. CD3-6]
MIKILVVDDHNLVGEGTKLLLEQEKDFKVTFVNSSEKALEILLKYEFDVFVFDLNMPGLNGQELAKEVSKISPKSNIIIYTGYDIEPHFNKLVSSGVSSFINKVASKETLIAAIRASLEGNSMMPINLLQQLKIPDNSINILEGFHLLKKYNLSKNEIETLRLVMADKTNKEIAAELFISLRTVEYRLSNIFKKLNVNSRIKAIKKIEEISKRTE